MDPTDRIEKCVFDGLVLDDAGQWVPVKQMVARERRFLAHLAHGEVILDGKWVSIAKAHEAAAASPAAPTADKDTDHAADESDVRSDLISALSDDETTSSPGDRKNQS